MNAVPKVVFSRTLTAANWNNSRLVRTRSGDEVAQLKRQSGGDLSCLAARPCLTH